MRMICPNCGAQYEVADDVIPETGRDVQCSNCGHTWFENPGASVAAEEEDTPYKEEGAIPQSWEAEADPTEQEPAPEPEPEPAEETAEADQYATDEAPEYDDDDEDARLTPAPTPPAPEPDGDAPQRQGLDPSIAEILQEEAAREEAARAAERDTGLESQGDLGLDEATGPEAQREREARERIARLKGEEDATAAAIAATVAGSRKELLPDIEEINSTLRPNEDQPEAEPLEEEVIEEQRRGFRFGFLMVLGIIIVLALVYLFADQISSAVPALEGVLESYVNAVDSLRIWLDVKIQGLLASLEASDTPES